MNKREFELKATDLLNKRMGGRSCSPWLFHIPEGVKEETNEEYPFWFGNNAVATWTKHGWTFEFFGSATEIE